MKQSCNLFLLLPLLLFACRKDVPIMTESSAIVYEVTLADTLDQNIRTNFIVRFKKEAPCAEFQETQIIRENNIYYYTIILRDEGELCTFRSDRDSIVENFLPDEAGEFLFRFHQGNGEYLEKDVIVRPHPDIFF